MNGDYYFWDPLAAAVMVDEGLSSFVSAPLTAEVEEGPDSGRIIAAPGGQSVRYATSADLEELEQRLLATYQGL